jgi:taurine--2-oxoglutarate transaminase
MAGKSMAPERQTVVHSWCRQVDWNAPTIVGGQGARLFTADGRTILDFSSLSECCNLGHQHPHVVAAIREQAEKLCFVTSAWGAESRAQLAELLLEKSGFAGGRVFFTVGGSDANEHAVKFARLASGKPRGWVITRDRSFHGATFGAGALSGDKRTARQADAEALRFLHAPPPYVYRCPFGAANAEACGVAAADHIGALIDEKGKDAVAAVVMETNSGTNGIVAPDSFWPALRDVTAERGVLLVADEVMSGFGRCGEWFAWQRYGEETRPDLMTLAKGLTGAHLPLGAVVLSAKVARAVEPQMLYSGLTYCGHPLSCAAAVAAIESYEREDLIARSRRLGAELLARLKQMEARHPSIGEVRGGQGLFVVVELVRDRATREPLAPWDEMHAALRQLLRSALEAGVSFGARGNLLLLAPPLVVEEKELSDALALLDRLLGELESELQADTGDTVIQPGPGVRAAKEVS